LFPFSPSFFFAVFFVVNSLRSFFNKSL
jgi:hypothetical protein